MEWNIVDADILEKIMARILMKKCFAAAGLLVVCEQENYYNAPRFLFKPRERLLKLRG